MQAGKPVQAPPTPALGRERLRVPAVLELVELVAEVGHDLLREHLGVVDGDVAGHGAHLEEEHEVADAEVVGEFVEFFGDVVGAAGDDVALFDEAFPAEAGLGVLLGLFEL